MGNKQKNLKRGLFAKKVLNLSKKTAKIFILFFGPLVIVLSLYNLLFIGKLYPGVYIANISIGGLKPNEAINVLAQKVSPPDKITLFYNNNSFEINLREIGFEYNLPESIDSAYSQDRTGNFLLDLSQRIQAPFRHKILGLRFAIDEDALTKKLTEVAQEIEVEPQFPSVELNGAQVVVHKGSPGTSVDLKKLRIDIGQKLTFAEPPSAEIKVSPIEVQLNEGQAESLKQRAENLLGKTLVLSFEDNTYVYKNEQLFDILSPSGGYLDENIKSLVADLADMVERSPQNPVFVFEEGKVKEFSPAKDGVEIKKETLFNMISGNLRTLEALEEKTAPLDIPVETTPPEIQTADVNNLGIKEMIGKGSSRFAGSIASRIYNIGLASSKFNGILVAPEEVFSFNNALGDVSGYTGYKQAYIIKDGKTILGDGGGVCQVSTTLFRAALAAGLPIVERRAHSYRVSYYEQDSAAGLDATVFAPTTDLKFKNNTPGHLLIQTRFDPKALTLVFEIYGTDDGRIASTTKPVVTSVVPPPPDLYQDDPTLPQGTVKQVDFKAWGAKASFDYVVKKDGEVIFEKTFYSNFKPWQAVYLRGTGPVN